MTHNQSQLHTHTHKHAHTHTHTHTDTNNNTVSHHQANKTLHDTFDDMQYCPKNSYIG